MFWFLFLFLSALNVLLSKHPTHRLETFFPKTKMFNIGSWQRNLGVNMKLFSLPLLIIQSYQISDVRNINTTWHSKSILYLMFNLLSPSFSLSQLTFDYGHPGWERIAICTKTTKNSRPIQAISTIEMEKGVLLRRLYFSLIVSDTRLLRPC